MSHVHIKFGSIMCTFIINRRELYLLIFANAWLLLQNFIVCMINDILVYQSIGNLKVKNWFALLRALTWFFWHFQCDYVPVVQYVFFCEHQTEIGWMQCATVHVFLVYSTDILVCPEKVLLVHLWEPKLHSLQFANLQNHWYANILVFSTMPRKTATFQKLELCLHILWMFCYDSKVNCNHQWSEML